MLVKDALSYHVYWSPPLTEQASPGELPVITQQVQSFVELMGEYGKVKPVYMTEGGIRCPPFASWLPKEGFQRAAAFGSKSGESVSLTGADAAAGLVKGMVQMISAGVVNICYYYTGGVQGAMPWFSTMANGYYVMMDYDGRPKPTMMAFSAMESLLGDAKPAKILNRDDLTIHLFARGKGSIAVVWSCRERSVKLSRGLTAFDMMGNKRMQNVLHVGEPVYICAPKFAPDKMADLIR